MFGRMPQGSRSQDKKRVLAFIRARAGLLAEALKMRQGCRESAA
jgi:hypothetical protein